MKTKPQRVRFRDGDDPSLKKGKINLNAQRCRGTLNVPGTVADTLAFKMDCTLCGLTYGSNGGEVVERKCPNCQHGEAGIRYWLIARKVPGDPVAANGSAKDVRVEYDTEENAADWLERTSGCFKDDPVFERMTEFSRKFRRGELEAADVLGTERE